MGFEDAYKVSNLGNVRSLDRVVEYIQTNQHTVNGGTVAYKNLKGRDLSPRLLPNGRRRVQMNNKDYYIYRLVVEAFIRPLQDKEEVNHIDGDKTNDKLENLEIVNRLENHDHACEMGLSTISKKSVRLELNGVRYDSIGAASRATGINKTSISKWLKDPNIKRNKKYEDVIIRLID